MILYRARTLASRPSRNGLPQSHTPEHRVRGRWFTSDLAAAIAYRDALEGDAEIIMVDVPDAIVDSFRVQTAPVTACQIDALSYSRCPATDYVIPMFYVMTAEPIAIAGEKRVRDYIDINGTMPPPMRIVERPAVPEPLPLAA